jgi:hypothetical protein
VGNTGGLVPLCVGAPDPAAAAPSSAAAHVDPSLSQRRSPLADPTIEWQTHYVEPRWQGREASDCAAALGPGSTNSAELNRFFDGAKLRGETALVLAPLGPSTLLAKGPQPVRLGDHGFVRGRPLATGARLSLAPGLGHADRDLGLQLKSSRADERWWSLSLDTGATPSRVGPSDPTPPAEGDLLPVLVGPMGEPVVAVWVSPDGSQRWYIIPHDTDWNVLLRWLTGHALPEFVIGALYRARSPLHVHPDLQTPAERAAQKALEEMSARHVAEKASHEAALLQARTAAEGIRGGLLDGTGPELEAAVGKVLTSAGFTVVNLDSELGGTLSADLLVTLGQERRLVEVKSVSGSASQTLAGKLTTHLLKWPVLRPTEPVGGGALIVNHEYGKLPTERSPKVYTDQAFLDTLGFPVLAARDLFDWWRAEDWTAIQQAVLA